MSLLKTTALAAVLATISSVSAHGMVQGIVADGHHPGYVVGYSYSPSHPPLVAWSQPENKDTGFIDPPMYKKPDVICGKGATPAELSATVAAGGTVELQWTEWPESHYGPVIDYLANCNGDCSSVDKTKLQFNKIDEAGLIDPAAGEWGKWASDDLKANNESWTVTIPKNIAPGNYVLRHEIIALHSANNLNGAQNYPQCVSLKVTGSGTDSLASGTVGTELYTPDEEGIHFNIYRDTYTSYPIPGPELHSGASSSAPTTQNGTSSSTPTTSSASGSGDSEATPTGASGPTATGAGYPTMSSAPYPTGNATIPQPKPSKKPKKPCTSSKAVDTAPTATSVVEPSTPSSTTAPSSGDEDYESPSTIPEEEAESPSTTPEDDEEATVPSPSETGSGSETSDDTEEPKDLSADSLAGMTVQQLIALLKLIVKELEGKMGGKVRRHARDFLDL
ncbi:MAG: hypothetical protein Q9174_003804 [Haloplaca sp. 1 TL-2023]